MMQGLRRSGTHRPRAVLLQIRSQRDAEVDEQLCFERAAGLPPEALHAINLVSQPQLRWDDLRDADLVFVGGAGAHSALDEHDFSPYLRDAILRLVDEGKPLLGSCWGHQFLARVLGGELETCFAEREVGTLDLELTDDGAQDPLFAELPRRFAVQLGHQDRVHRLPPGAVHLARSARCRHQAFRLAGKPVYGTQFHPEMSIESMRVRLHIYRHYTPDDQDLQEALGALRPSPESDRLLRRFVELFT